MSTFEKKIAGGVPVIFQEELEQSLVARQQMQPQAERPVRPPSYVQQSASGGGGGGPGGWGEGGVPFGSVGRVMREFLCFFLNMLSWKCFFFGCHGN